MKIAVISDIHSNLEAFQSILDHMGETDQTLCLGDFVGYGAKPNEVIQLAKSLKMVSVAGNHDYASLTDDTKGFNPYAAAAAHWTHRHLTKEGKEFLSHLPLTAKINVGGYRIYLVHGSPADPLNEYIFPGTSEELLRNFLQRTNVHILLLGHTHVPMLATLREGFVLNPGGVGQPRDYDPRASYATIIIENGKPSFHQHRVKYDVDKAANWILASGLPSILAERLYTGW